MGKRGRKVGLVARQEIISLVKEALDTGCRKTQACKELGISIRTLERWTKSPNRDDLRKGPIKVSNKLTEKEKDKIIKITTSEKYRDMSPVKIVPALADLGIYLASESTFYRVLKAEKLLAHRGRSKVPVKRVKQESISYAPNQVWSWDITYLKGPIKGSFYYLYMIMDIFSRKIVGWHVHNCESSEYASVVLQKAINKEGISSKGLKLHSDNGSPMKGSTMLSTMQRLGVVPSFSRPSVSDDNPYSESLFKTLKYSPFYPNKAFKCIDGATNWVNSFVNWYNNEHLHSNIKFVPPALRHKGLDKVILFKRKSVYENAKKKNPLRWSKNVRNWDFIDVVKLNPIKQRAA